jgi:hypothetical protein
MWRPRISAARPSRLGPAVLAHDGFADPAGQCGMLYPAATAVPASEACTGGGRRDPVAWRWCAVPGHDLVRINRRALEFPSKGPAARPPARCSRRTSPDT